MPTGLMRVKSGSGLIDRKVLRLFSIAMAAGIRRSFACATHCPPLESPGPFQCQSKNFSVTNR